MADPSNPHKPLDIPTRTSPQSPHSLAEFREHEGRENRKQKLENLWKSLPAPTSKRHPAYTDAQPVSLLTQERAQSLKERYDDELVGRCAGPSAVSRSIEWKEFKQYAEAKETGVALSWLSFISFSMLSLELWSIFHDELDLDGNGQLDALELALALEKAGALGQLGC